MLALHSASIMTFEVQNPLPKTSNVCVPFDDIYVKVLAKFEAAIF